MAQLHESVKDFFFTNWNPVNTNGVTPSFYYARDFKQFHLAEDRLVFYDRSGEKETPSGLGYNCVNTEDSFGIDIYSHTSQTLVDSFRIEALRLLRTVKKSLLDMDYIIVDNNGIPASVPGYSIYRWVVEAYGKKYGKLI